jgi:hypothetical protein
MSAEIEFYLKFSVPYIIILVSLLNLTLQLGKEHLWIILLCTCMAYLMPSPEVRNSIKTLTPNNNI